MNHTTIKWKSIAVTAALLLLFQIVPTNSQSSEHNSAPKNATFVDILRPLLAVPTIQEKGATFEILVYSDASSVSRWNAAIFTEYDSFTLQIVNINMQSLNTWSLNVTIPSYVREDLYDIAVEADGIIDIEPHAVSVVERIDSKFKFIQVTDTHIGSLSGGSTYTKFGNVIEEINLIHPDFVIITGDCCDKEPTLWSRQEFPADLQDYKFRELLLKFDVPTYVTTGNHDYSYVSESSIEDFKSVVCPLLNYVFEYGDYFFIGFDSGKYISLINSDSAGYEAWQIQWLEGELNKHNNATQKFVFCHYPPDKVSHYSAEYKEIMRKYNVSLSIHGHVHEDRVFDRNYTRLTEDGSVNALQKPLFVTTRATAKGTNNGYRLIKVDGTNLVYTYDGDNNGVPDDITSTPIGQLSLSYHPSNDGTASTVVATITNNLHESFEKLFLKFDMPKLQHGYVYEAENGTVEQYIPCTTNDVVYVRTDINATTQKNVTLKPVPGKSINLTAGWNLISIPFLDSPTPVEQALKDITGKYDIVEYYDAKDPTDKWKIYSTAKPAYLNDLKFIDNKMGVWVHVLSNCSILVPLSPKPVTISLEAGWNLVGYPSLNAKRIDIALASIPYSKIQTFSEKSAYNLKDLKPADELKMGFGYWLYVDRSCDWTIDW